VKRLRAGKSCYAAFLNAKGKMRGEGHIICQPDAFLLETNPGLLPSLERFIITEDVIIEDVSDKLGEWLVVGRVPSRGDGFAPAEDSEPAMPADAITFSHPLGVGVISATPMVATVSAEDFEILRVEAGVPLWGVDMNETTIPDEAGLAGRATSYDKGCYVGQETIARIKTYGHVNRRLIQCKVDGAEVPDRGAKILAGDKEAGHVTSAVRSPKFGGPLALAFVRRELAKPGTLVTVDGNQAEVIGLCGS
jgi:folate-binding protein YgfZ